MKNTYSKWFVLSLICAVGAVVALFINFKVFKLRVNTTASMPRGIYRVYDTMPGKGDFVELCMPYIWNELAVEREYLERSYRCDGVIPLVKQLEGLPGDKVNITNDGIVINGFLEPLSKIKNKDSKGRAMPSDLKSGIIPNGKALVLSRHANGLDGRYFGLVDLVKLKRVKPLLTF